MNNTIDEEEQYLADLEAVKDYGYDEGAYPRLNSETVYSGAAVYFRDELNRGYSYDEAMRSAFHDVLAELSEYEYYQAEAYQKEYSREDACGL